MAGLLLYAALLHAGARYDLERGEFHSEELELLPKEMDVEPVFDEFELDQLRD